MLLFFFTITFRSILQKLWPAVLRLVFQPQSTDEWALSRAHAENVTEILVRRETDKYGGCTLGVCVCVCLNMGQKHFQEKICFIIKI